MISTLNLTEISTLLMALFTFVITAANVLVVMTMRRTINLQVKSGHTENHQALVQGHRDLFLGLLHHPKILKTFAEANGLSVDEWEHQIIAALFINQAFVHFLNFSNGTISESYMEGFKRDASEIFNLSTVQAHWQNSRQWYSAEFRSFIDHEVLQLKPGKEHSKSAPVATA